MLGSDEHDSDYGHGGEVLCGGELTASTAASYRRR
jgi:hypothetical protein